jgi:hypothetical protein
MMLPEYFCADYINTDMTNGCIPRPSDFFNGAETEGTGTD